MILVYTYKITPRFTYIMRHIFTRMLQVEVNFTATVEDFIAHQGPKITYTRQPLQSEFFIRSHDLLFEQGISDPEINMYDWDEVPAFFPTNEKSAIPFDIFAASFYLMSRYEEYLPHVKDEHGRYPAAESLAYREGFLELPVIDLWVMKFRQELQLRFPEMVFGEKVFEQQMLIDVPVIYRYKKRGIIRTLGGTLLDLAGLRLKEVARRYVVLLGLRKDPYDIFDKLIVLHRKYKVNAIFFFLMADYSTYDKNISVYNPRFKSVVKSVADYNIVSLMAGYKAYTDVQALKQERLRLINFINRPVKRVRQRFNRLSIPETYRQISDAEFNEDYTMGYTRIPGFRAGTCTPFYFYDISFEVQLPLKVSPCCMQYNSFQHLSSPHEVERVMMELRQRVQMVKGTFNVVFSNDILQREANNPWSELYLKLIKADYHV